MSDSASGFERVIKELASPWDWVAAGVGAAGGCAATAILHGTDMGTSIATGAIAAIAARKAAGASFADALLRRRARRLLGLWRTELREPHHGPHPPFEYGLSALIEELERELRLFRSGGMSHSDFSKRIEAVVDKYRKLFEIEENGAVPSGRYGRLAP